MSPYEGINLKEAERSEMLEVLDFLQQDIVIGSPVKDSAEFKPSVVTLEDLAQLPKSFFNYFEIVQA
jgi:hypothetical protein